jgi:parallel beta-helix repeat protein
MFCALFGFATAASAATIDDVPNNSLLIGNDVYQLSDTENYTFENVINSITSYGSTPVPMLFKWGGMWFDLYINYSSILDMNENHEGYVPRSQMITRQYGTLYGSGNETGTIDPVRSTYKFAYVVPDPLLKGEPTEVNVGIVPDVLGAAGYEDVIFVFDAVGPADSTVKFEAIDSTGKPHVFFNSGTWGPPAGFDIGAAYEADTDWTLTFSDIGEYTITFKLVEVADHSKVIAQGSETVTVDDYSTYSFGYTVPELIIAGQDSKVNVSLSTVDVGTLDYDAVRFYFAKIDGADDVIFKATDSKGVEHTFTNSGAWGPGGGFPLPKVYSATTEWTLNFSQAGNYTIQFQLKCESTGAVIASGQQEIEVDPVTRSVYRMVMDGPDGLFVNDVGTFTITTTGDGTGNTGCIAIYDYQITGGAGKLEYQDEEGDWHELPLKGKFGPEVGFELTTDYNVTTELRFTPEEVGVYSFTLALKTMEGVKLAETSGSITSGAAYNQNSGLYYTSIQAAINAAQPGDTILVPPGTYVGTIDITQSVTLRSMEGPEKTIIKGAPFDYYIVNIKADNVVLDGFTVTAPDYTGTADASGITTHLAGTKSNLRITNCIIHHIGVDDRSNVSMGSFGINVGPVDGIEIDHNIIYDIHHAAAGAWANGIMVWGNNASVPAKDVHIHDNTIYNISSPEHSLDGAIILSSNTENAVVENNNIYNVRNLGISTHPQTLNASIIRNNTFDNIKGGLGAAYRSRGPHADTVTGNTFSNCDVGVLVLEAGGAPVLENNNFVNNGIQLNDLSETVDIDAVLADNSFDQAVVVRDGGEGAIKLPSIFGTIQGAVDKVYQLADPGVLTTYAICVLKDSDENIGIIQSPNKNVILQPVMDGGDYADVTLQGTVTIDGQGRYNGAESLAIQGFKFDFSNRDDEADIITTKILGSGYAYNYAHNVVIKDCAFIGNDSNNIVGIRFAAQGGYNGASVINCTGAGLHSLGQFTSVRNVTIKDCEVTGRSGFNLRGPAGSVEVAGFDFEGSGYGLRLGPGTAEGTTLTIRDSNIVGTSVCTDAELNDPETALVLRDVAPRNIMILNSTITNINEGSFAIANTNGTNASAYTFNIGSVDTGEGYFNPERLGGLDGAKIHQMIANADKGTYHFTIQEAINAAEAGDTIEVPAGVYTGELNISKALTLLGANAGVAGVGERGDESIVTGKVQISGSSKVVINGFKFYDDTFDASQPRSAMSVYSLAGHEIVNNVFERVGSNPQENGEYVNCARRNAIELAGGPSGDVTIANNLFTGAEEGIYRNRSWTSAIYFNGGANDTVIKDNVFEYNRTALNIDNYAEGYDITGNQFNYNGTALTVGGSSVGEYVLSGNQFANNDTHLNLRNVGNNFVIDVSGNTFGGKTPEAMSDDELFALEDKILHRVDNENYGLAIVKKDNVFVTADSGSIQRGVDAAGEGWTVNVAAGTFLGKVKLTKPLTLLGAQAGVDARSRSGVEESIIDGNGIGYVIDIDGANANNIIIDGFTIQNPTQATTVDSSLILIQSSAMNNNITIRNNIIQDPGVRTVNRSWGAYGINGSKVTNLVVEQNYFKDILCDEATHGDSWNTTGAIWLWGDLYNIIVRDNKIENASSYGIGISYGVTDAIFEGNEITGIGTPSSAQFPAAIMVRSTDSGASSGIEVLNNKIHANDGTEATAGIDIAGLANTEISDITIEGNEITGNAIGIRVRGLVSDLDLVSNNKIVGNTIGIENTSNLVVDASLNWWGSADPAVIAENISGNVDFNPWWLNEEMTLRSDEAAVAAVNAAEKAEMKDVLEANAFALGLDLSGYNALLYASQVRVSFAVFEGAPYDNAAAVIEAFDRAVALQGPINAVNGASSVAAMYNALVANAGDLGINVAAFETWPQYYKDKVAQYVIDQRPGTGYDTVEGIKDVYNFILAFDGDGIAGVSVADEAEAVNAVNAAATEAEMQSALENNQEKLGLDWAEFAALSAENKKLVINHMRDGQPYINAVAVQTRFNNAVK